MQGLRKHMDRDGGKHQYWRKAQGIFRAIGDGKYGGFRKGVRNGPVATTKRGAKRNKSRNPAPIPEAAHVS